MGSPDSTSQDSTEHVFKLCTCGSESQSALEDGELASTGDGGESAGWPWVASAGGGAVSVA
eukprot:m.90640 g.90640  ORF g.90640 m.90640 type:complete len:61 (-) comp20135_c0_seq2:1538-1720(-)